jgi:CDP-diacylglycerol--glycerol-3-phosphate 3-phosphatidyltransferase
VFVSGLREFLGDTAGTLKVTQMAKWKTTVQMVAVAVLLAHGAFAASVAVHTMGMDAAMVQSILEGTEADLFGLRWRAGLATGAFWIGIALLWLAAVLTFLTGLDYFRKAMPYLKD